MIVTWTKPPCWRLLDDVRSGDVAPRRRGGRAAPPARSPTSGFARVDHHRALRQGLPEAVYGPGKTPEQCAAIVAELLDAGAAPVLLTRADDEQAAAALAANPGGERARHHRSCGARPPRGPSGSSSCTAGTADLPVADECAAVLTPTASSPSRLTDVGVAGIHRLLAEADVAGRADAVVVVAGMEGALASVVGGLTPAPGRRRAHQRRLRRRPRGRHRAAGDARVVRRRAHRRRHRQRLRRRLRRRSGCSK